MWDFYFEIEYFGTVPVCLELRGSQGHRTCSAESRKSQANWQSPYPYNRPFCIFCALVHYCLYCSFVGSVLWVLRCQMSVLTLQDPSQFPWGLLLPCFPYWISLIPAFGSLCVISIVARHQHTLVFLWVFHLMWCAWMWPLPSSGVGPGWLKPIHGYYSPSTTTVQTKSQKRVRILKLVESH